MAESVSFPLLGEPLALDLVNTRVHAGGGDVDLLEHCSGLSAWLAAQASRIRWEGQAEERDLDTVRHLRDAVAALLVARRSDTQPTATTVAALNAALAPPLATPRLTWTENGPRIDLTGEPEGAALQVDVLARVVALDAITLLTGPEAGLLRTCEHPTCVLQFLARNPRRRWCSAATCGNRARVARHHFRHHATSPSVDGQADA